MLGWPWQQYNSVFTRTSSLHSSLQSPPLFRSLINTVRIKFLWVIQFFLFNIILISNYPFLLLPWTADCLLELVKKEIKLDLLIPVDQIIEKILRQKLHISEKYTEVRGWNFGNCLHTSCLCRVHSTLNNKRRRKCDGQDWENISLREMLQTQQVTSTMKAVLLMTRFK